MASAFCSSPRFAWTVARFLRRQIDDWLQQQGLTPVIVGEFDDSALMKVFGENGVGAFAAPSVIERDVRQRYRVVSIGAVDAIRGRVYAISVERRVKHPAVAAIAMGARADAGWHAGERAGAHRQPKAESL